MSIDFLLLGIGMGIVLGYFLGCKECDWEVKMQDEYIEHLKNVLRELEEKLLKKKEKKN